MHRFWADPSSFQDQNVTIKGRLFHHICRVCRFKQGQKFILLSEGGYKYIVELKRISKTSAQGLILERHILLNQDKPEFHVALSCPRFSVLESLLKKLVELGVDHFHPFSSDFSFIRKPGTLQKSRMERWKNIVQHSRAQSLSPKETQLYSLVHLPDVLNLYKKSSNAQALFFYEGEDCQSFQKVLDSYNMSVLDEIWIFIGSEGGFSPQEVSFFQSYKIEPVSLGQKILKVETACLTVLGVLQYKLNRL